MARVGTRYLPFSDIYFLFFLQNISYKLFMPLFSNFAWIKNQQKNSGQLRVCVWLNKHTQKNTAHLRFFPHLNLLFSPYKRNAGAKLSMRQDRLLHPPSAVPSRREKKDNPHFGRQWSITKLLWHPKFQFLAMYRARNWNLDML